MANFELESHGHVAAAPGQFWAHLVDRETVPCWLEGVSALVSDGDRFLARTDDAAGSAPGGAGWISGEVQVAEPRERLALRLDAPASGLREARVEVRLRPEDGGTSFDLRVVGVPGMLGSLLVPLLRLRTEVAMARAVRGFRAALEARKSRKRRPFEEPCPERALARAERQTLAAGAAL